MAVPNSTPISFAEIRAEGNKTSWVSPAYPTVGRPYNIDPNWMMSVDENNQIGLNPSDGSFSIAQMQGWDTWKRPQLGELWMQQFGRSYGVRIHWETITGDPFRSAFAIYRSQTESDVTGKVATALIAIVRYGPEWTGNKKLDITAGSNKFVCLDANAQWSAILLWGKYDGVTLPDASRVVDPTAISTETPVKMSFVDTVPSGAAVGGSSPYYYSVVPLDGRQLHTLGAAINPGNFDISTNPTTSGSYNQGSIFQYEPNESPESDAVVGKGLKIFTDSGNWSLDSKGASEATFMADYLYYYYLNVGEISYQVQEGNVFDASHDGTIGWTDVPRTNFFGIQNLTTSTTYTVFVNSLAGGQGQDYPGINFTTNAASGEDAAWNAPDSVAITVTFGNDPYQVQVSVTEADQTNGTKIRLRMNDGQIKFIPYSSLDANGTTSTSFSSVNDDAGTIRVTARNQSADDATWSTSISDSAVV